MSTTNTLFSGPHGPAKKGKQRLFSCHHRYLSRSMLLLVTAGDSEKLSFRTARVKPAAPLVRKILGWSRLSDDATSGLSKNEKTSMAAVSFLRMSRLVLWNASSGFAFRSTTLRNLVWCVLLGNSVPYFPQLLEVPPHSHSTGYPTRFVSLLQILVSMLKITCNQSVA